MRVPADREKRVPAEGGKPVPAEGPESPLRVVVLTGPTAAGKTALALELAETLGAEIVNADSMQVYRFMDVGTAKPSASERARVPHHLLDVVLPDEPYDAARYAVEAEAAIARIHERGRPVLLVGGSGLYLRALLQGLSSGVGRDPEQRRRLEGRHAEALAEGDAEWLHRTLREIDPQTAARLHPNDVMRLVRALEIHAATGRPPSEVLSEPSSATRFDALQLVIDPGREELAQRIDRRCEAMIEGGLLQEVRALRERGYGPELQSMRAIGYRHMQPVIEGLETLANVLEQLKRDTRQYARRQRTWFRAIPEAIWLQPDQQQEINARAKAHLSRES
jgi:tRNA dimethylallyltransferase